MTIIKYYRNKIKILSYNHFDDAYLSINFDHGLAMARIYFISAVCAKADPEKNKYSSFTNIMARRELKFCHKFTRIALRLFDVFCTENDDLLHFD